MIITEADFKPYFFVDHKNYQIEIVDKNSYDLKHNPDSDLKYSTDYITFSKSISIDTMNTDMARFESAIKKLIRYTIFDLIRQRDDEKLKLFVGQPVVEKTETGYTVSFRCRIDSL